mmetsp:Transcript_9770/g.20863  ORF Transcript_9770/g.20863 Transcript_9770/m.20863 type:complete len:265 (-) Transcript_9770:344-1138(-)
MQPYADLVARLLLAPTAVAEPAAPAAEAPPLLECVLTEGVRVDLPHGVPIVLGPGILTLAIQSVTGDVIKERLGLVISGAHILIRGGIRLFELGVCGLHVESITILFLEVGIHLRSQLAHQEPAIAVSAAVLSRTVTTAALVRFALALGLALVGVLATLSALVPLAVLPVPAGIALASTLLATIPLRPFATTVVLVATVIIPAVVTAPLPVPAVVAVVALALALPIPRITALPPRVGGTPATLARGLASISPTAALAHRQDRGV